MSKWIAAACSALLMIWAGSAAAAAAAAQQDDSAAVQADLETALRAQDFKALDAQAEALMQPARERMPDGSWRLSFFYYRLDMAMRGLCRTESGCAALIRSVEAYDRANPKSRQGGLFHALALETDGWRARGHGYGGEVSEQGWQVFGSRMSEARRLLDFGHAAMASNPVWYDRRIEVALYCGESLKQIDAILERGIAVSPHYLQMYFGALNARFPQWNGDEQAVMRFINDYGHRSPVAESEGMYARLLWYADCCTPTIVDDPALDWEAVRKGIDVLVRDYPAQRNIQRLFYMACYHPDKAEALKLLPLVHGAPIEDALGPGNSAPFELCLDWARGKEASIAIRRPQLGTTKIIK